MEIAIIILLLIIAALAAFIAYRVAKPDTPAAVAPEVDLEPITQALSKEFSTSRTEAGQHAAQQRKEVVESIASLGKSVGDTIDRAGKQQKQQLDDSAQLQKESLEEMTKRLSVAIQTANMHQRERLEGFEKTLKDSMNELSSQSKELREKLEKSLKDLREDNAKELDKIRVTVDEKLQTTLEKKLGDSFRLVSEQLQNVSKGLGEMQSLTSGVDDLNRTLTNVQKRGEWGEIRLESILESAFSRAQFESQVEINEDSSEKVDFVIKLPSQDGGQVLLPIDAKFPREDYERINAARDARNEENLEKAQKDLYKRVEAFAKDIGEKYVRPPKTSDYAVMFLPTEGLLSEIIRDPEFARRIQNEYHVVITGPTSIYSVINAARMVIRDASFQASTAQLYKTINNVMREFSVFGEALRKAKKNLRSASRHIATIDSSKEKMLGDLQTAQSLEGKSHPTLEIEGGQNGEGDFEDDDESDEDDEDGAEG